MKDDCKQCKETQKRASAIIDREYGLLSQRLNYFLVGTAFLVGAFATLIAADKLCPNTPDSYIIILAHFICGAGYYLSLFFLLANYLNMKVIQAYKKILDKMERCELFLNTPKKFENKAFEKHKIGFGTFLSDLISVTTEPSQRNRRLPMPQTWLIPLGFAVFWALVWGILLPPDEKFIGNYCIFQIIWWPQTTFILFIPILYLIIKNIIPVLRWLALLLICLICFTIELFTHFSRLSKGQFAQNWCSCRIITSFFVCRLQDWLKRKSWFIWLMTILVWFLFIGILVFFLQSPHWVGDIRDTISSWFKLR